MTLLDRQAIDRMGFASVGKNVAISDRASFYGCRRISIGDNVRIDDFSVLSAGISGITIWNHVHIAVHASLIGAGKISLADFCNISSRVAIYSSSDDFSGSSMTNPTIPNEFCNVFHADVFLQKHVVVGSGSVILPGVTLEEGAAVGALSLIKNNCQAFGIYAGSPAKLIGERKRNLLALEKAFIASLEISGDDR